MHEQAIEHLRRPDPVLALLIGRLGPCALRPDGRTPPSAALVRAVAHQQLTGKAARTILNRVKALHPGRKFPTPDDLWRTPDDHLRGAGLSRAKVAAVKDIAAKVLSGHVPTTRELK